MTTVLHHSRTNKPIRTPDPITAKGFNFKEGRQYNVEGRKVTRAPNLDREERYAFVGVYVRGETTPFVIYANPLCLVSRDNGNHWDPSPTCQEEHLPEQIDLSRDHPHRPLVLDLLKRAGLHLD